MTGRTNYIKKNFLLKVGVAARRAWFKTLLNGYGKNYRIKKGFSLLKPVFGFLWLLTNFAFNQWKIFDSIRICFKSKQDL